MATSRVEQIWGQFQRATDHHDSWNATFDAWLEGNPYSVRGNLEAESWFVVRLVVFQEPPFLTLALIFADYLHNLRAVLEHLVWHLVALNGGNATHNTGFPVVMEAKDWGAQRGSKLAGFPNPFVNVVKDAQPFNDSPNASRHWLHLLHELDIRYKHRLLLRLGITDFEWKPTFEFNRPAEEGDSVQQILPMALLEYRDGEELVRVREVSKQGDLRVVKLSQNPIEVHIGVGPFVPDLIVDSGQLPDWDGEVRRVIELLIAAFES